MPLDADTKKYLDEVKKGKPRKFAMIMKGEKILSLIVYKKGTVEKYKKQAKEEGKGQFYFGVVDGKGQDISFKLSVADGFDEPPGKDVKLKAFLAEEAGMKFKPAYQIVAELPGVDESDDEADAPSQAPPAAPAAPPEVTSEAFTARFKGLLPDLKKAQAAAPLREQLTKLTAAAQVLGKDKRFADGMKVLDKLEELVKQALAGESVRPAAPPVDGTEFMNRFKALVPELKQAQAAGTPRGDTLAALAARAQTLGKEKKYADGMKVLDELEAVIKQALSGGEARHGADFAKHWTVAKQAWRTANDTVDDQIAKLEALLRESGHAGLEAVAEFGLNGLTANHKVRLMAAMRDIDAAGGKITPKLAANTLRLAKDFQKHINADPRVTVCDANPFGVTVTIRKSISGALDRIIAAVQTAS
jgi:hypothetical protein